MERPNCQLLREVSRSGAASVHLGLLGGAEVVVKRFDPLPGQDPRAWDLLRAEFVQQAHAQARLRHANIARVVGEDLGDPRPWYALERVPGARRLGSLPSPLDPEALARLVEAVARGVAHAHEQGVLHGLLTADDVLLDHSLRPVLIGFGRGARVLAARRRGDHLAGLELLLGGAPELLGGQPPERASDVYGLGLLLYEALCGRAPHHSNAPIDARQRLTRMPPAPSRIRSGVDPALEAIAMRCLELTPAARFPSAAAVAEALAARRGEVGERVGPYRLLAELGRGGMGRVWRARDERSGRQVALKVMAPEANPGRFAREVQHLRALDHPHVVRLLDAGEDAGRPFLALELHEGTTLEALARGGELPARQAARILAQIARGLEHAHQRGVVHRDVKPANVLVRPDGRAVLLDLGLAKSISPRHPDHPLTRRFTLVGTPHFAAPEQIVDGAAVGPATDLFALGLTLWAALTGEPPFARSTLGETCQAILHAPLPALHASRPDAPPALEAVCRRLLARDPRARYAGAGEVALRLELIASGQVPSPDPRGALLEGARPGPEDRQQLERPPGSGSTTRTRRRLG